ncbi:PIN domain-containing protein [Botrimarina sp.]|uniref:PIN domain-containing protein n=1 Tax=Botrimarina sp. TaxID=2795802 RepID=UPI0032EEA722
MIRYVVDTNVLLRFLLADSDRLTTKARRLFAQAEQSECLLVVTDLAIAEAVWVLESFYEVERQVTSSTLMELLGKPGLLIDNRALMEDSLRRYGQTKIDFLDCYLAARCAASGDTVASFDKDFRKFPDVSRWTGD